MYENSFTSPPSEDNFMIHQISYIWISIAYNLPAVSPFYFTSQLKVGHRYNHHKQPCISDFDFTRIVQLLYQYVSTIPYQIFGFYCISCMDDADDTEFWWALVYRSWNSLKFRYAVVHAEHSYL